MASLRNTREALLLGYSEGWLDEMEFLALYDLNTSENLEFPYDLVQGSVGGHRFSWNIRSETI